MQAQEYSAMGVFDDLDKAEKTVDELRRAGFNTSEIGIIGHVSDQPVPIPLGMRTPENNAANSVVIGGIGGAIIGLIVVLVVPHLGEVTGLGMWFELLGGAVLGAAVGGVLLAFGSFMFFRPRSRIMARELESGHVIVTVAARERINEAVALLRHEGATKTGAA